MLLYRVCFLVYNLRSHSVLRIGQNTRYFGELRDDKLALTRALKNEMADKKYSQKGGDAK